MENSPSLLNTLTFDLVLSSCSSRRIESTFCVFFFFFSIYIWRRLWVLAHTHIHTHTLTDRLTHPLLFLRSARDGEGRGEDGEGESERITRLSVPLAGGLYGWEWGVFSAPGFTSPVSEEIPQNQPEGRKADHHRHGGAVPNWQAAHKPRVPHGEYYTTLYTCCVCVCTLSFCCFGFWT